MTLALQVAIPATETPDPGECAGHVFLIALRVYGPLIRLVTSGVTGPSADARVLLSVWDRGDRCRLFLREVGVAVPANALSVSTEPGGVTPTPSPPPTPINRLSDVGPDVERLVERIGRGQCIPLLGPGVVVDPTSQASFSTRLAQRLAADHGVQQVLQGASVTREQLRYVAEAFVRAHDRDELERVTADLIKEFPDTPTPFHRDMAVLPFSLCIEISPTAMMANALREQGKAARVAHYHFKESVPEPLAGNPNAPLVYHLYGRIEVPDSLVLTESDLVDFLGNVIRNEPPLPAWMRALVRKSNTEFLFLGFGFHNWYVRVLLHALGVLGLRERPSYALEDNTFFSDPECHQTVGFFRRGGDRGGGIKFQSVGWNEFAARLRQVYGERASPTPIPARRPVAFLSYASENEETVTRLRVALQSRGVEIWQDNKDLRAGDRWAQALTHVISKDVDYLVVVQSAAMLARTEGVFYAEIACARERQKAMPPTQRFLLPVSIDGQMLPELQAEFHVEQVATDAGVDRLVESISQDFSKRQARVPHG